MSKVFVSVGMSLDGFIAGPNGSPENPMGDRGHSNHTWVFRTNVFRRLLKLGGEGEMSPDNDLLAQTFARIGANIMGKRMFDEGEVSWPEEAPFRCPVFVLTKEKRAPWQRPGGTTFHFVNEPIERVLARAREVAGEKDVRISGGRDVIVQYLNAGLVDELEIALAPNFLGAGVRLFDGIDAQGLELGLVRAIESPFVTHLRYTVKKRGTTGRD